MSGPHAVYLCGEGGGRKEKRHSRGVLWLRDCSPVVGGTPASLCLLKLASGWEESQGLLRAGLGWIRGCSSGGQCGGEVRAGGVARVWSGSGWGWGWGMVVVKGRSRSR